MIIYNKGFSLVELIVIIAILSVLAASVTLAVLRYIEKERQATDIYHASLIKDALSAYQFPSSYQGTEVDYYDPDTGVTETEASLRENEENPQKWFPSGPDKEYKRKI